MKRNRKFRRFFLIYRNKESIQLNVISTVTDFNHL